MSKKAIIEKLETFLNSHMPPDEECYVVYLLVEVRKILEHENNGKYPICKFYADWCVHTAKDKVTQQIKLIIQGIHKEFFDAAVKRLPINKEQKLHDFLSMDELRKELRGFLQVQGLPDSIIERANWVRFQSLLVRILADQPINNPCDGIKKFSYNLDGGGREFAEIEYEQKPAEYVKFNFGGVNKITW
jgi:hypothetical protein